MAALAPAADELVAAVAALEAAEAAEELWDAACDIAEVTCAPTELVTDATADDYGSSAYVAQAWPSVH